MTRQKKTIIDQLRQAIEDSGESQLALANATGVDQGSLSRFIRGDRGISLETAATLCSYLNLHLAPMRN